MATIGTTATGSVDPLPDMLALRDRHGFRLHADAAYGGYFVLAGNLAPTRARPYDRLGEVDSIVIDPHKHGLQPYGCGCVLFRDPAVGSLLQARLAVHVLQLGGAAPGRDQPRMLARRGARPSRCGRRSGCCRSCGGEFARLWTAARRRSRCTTALPADPRFLPAVRAGARHRGLGPAGARAHGRLADPRRIFAEAARRDLHLALAELPAEFFDLAAAGIDRDRDTITCLRSVLMKPEHRAWVGRIVEILGAATDASV